MLNCKCLNWVLTYLLPLFNENLNTYINALFSKEFGEEGVSRKNLR